GGAGGARGGRQRSVPIGDFLIDRTEVSGEDFKKFLDRLAKENPALVEIYRPRFPQHNVPEKKLPEFKKGWEKARPDPWRKEEDARVAWIKNEDGTWAPLKGWEKRPVGGVCFEAARAYAGSIGKRLPTSEEWEKAARGVDGRKYPWGAQFEESRVASSKHPQAHQYPGWTIIHPAESMPEGASPYGVLHMAGNFSEWTSTDFKIDHKVNRGGCAFDEIEMFRCSSLDNTRPADYNGALGFRCVMDVK
ncbi:MAG: formylglycine-generating enzyme family protein, partial [Planctomycetota bacterium]